MPVQSLGQEDPLKEGMATLSNILAWKIPWTKEPGGLQSMGLQRVRHDWSDFACTDLKIFSCYFKGIFNIQIFSPLFDFFLAPYLMMCLFSLVCGVSHGLGFVDYLLMFHVPLSFVVPESWHMGLEVRQDSNFICLSRFWVMLCSFIKNLRCLLFLPFVALVAIGTNK